ncbi:hypothetical protein [Streptomyces sp. NPDC046859]|uniref:hypothetical protein n=1 Tax=Streptomyces sp. NPDC046859 TaxID=3155734 RepID=UPI0033C58B9F
MKRTVPRPLPRGLRRRDARLCPLALRAPAAAGPVLGTLAETVRRRPPLIGLNLLLAALPRQSAASPSRTADKSSSDANPAW